MAKRSGADTLDPDDRDRARQLGATWLLDAPFYPELRVELFKHIAQISEHLAKSNRPDAYDRGTLAFDVGVLLRKKPEVIKLLREHKVSSYDDPATRDDLFYLMGLLVVDDYLNHEQPRYRFPGLRRMGDRSGLGLRGRRPLQTAARSELTAGEIKHVVSRGDALQGKQAISPLRAARDQLHECLSSPDHTCIFARPWCRGVAECTIPMSAYVTPNAKLFDAAGSATNDSLDDAVDAWLEQSEARHLLLLGEFGVGKSAACLHIAERLITNQVDGAPEVVPVYIPLATSSQNCPPGRLPALIGHALGLKDLDDVIDPTVPPAQRIYLLDGLDEMSPSATIAGIRANLSLLAPFLDGGSRVILTCRTHLFSSIGELESALSVDNAAGDLLNEVRASQRFVIAELEDLDPSQAREVIQRVLPTENAEAVWDELHGYHRLQGLAKRPILLGMVLNVLPRLRELAAAGQRLDEAKIYETYARKIIQRESKNRRVPLDDLEALGLAESIAFLMFKRNGATIETHELEAEIQTRFSQSIRSTDDFKAFAHYARTSSMLTRRLTGSYWFIHASFREFFIARAFLTDLTARTPIGTWASQWVPREVAAFLAQLVQSQEYPRAIPALIELAAQSNNETELWNALHILSLIDPESVNERRRRLIAGLLVPRGFDEPRAVLVRQYARLAARYTAVSSAEYLVGRVLIRVQESTIERAAHNETYINYYGGADAACAAFVQHLAHPARKYDRHLHLNLLAELGTAAHADQLEVIAVHWSGVDAAAAAAAIEILRSKPPS